MHLLLLLHALMEKVHGDINKGEIYKSNFKKSTTNKENGYTETILFLNYSMYRSLPKQRRGLRSLPSRTSKPPVPLSLRTHQSPNYEADIRSVIPFNIKRKVKHVLHFVSNLLRKVEKITIGQKIK